MKLTKQQRIDLQAKFDGLCAYCGSVLGKSFHADHLDPVLRQTKWVSGRGYVPTGGLDYPERDALDNLMPACASCNIDKSSLTLEQWRTKLSHGPTVLSRNNPTYRHSLRFNLIRVTGEKIVFYFEKCGVS